MSHDVDLAAKPRLTRSVVLVGIMGAGKTSIGRRLASALGAEFFDSDHEIEKAANMKVTEIFENFGEAYFRDGERRVIARLMDGPPCVLATGGGVFAAERNRAKINENGVSVWLNASLETLWSRVKDRATRPLLQQPNPKKILSDLLEARRAHYALADIEVVSDAGVSHETMVARVVEALRLDDKKHADRSATLKDVLA